MIKLNGKKNQTDIFRSNNIHNTAIQEKSQSTLGVKRYNLKYFEEPIGEKLKLFFSRVNKMHNEIKLNKRLKYENDQKYYNYNDKNTVNSTHNLNNNRTIKNLSYENNNLRLNENNIQYNHNFQNLLLNPNNYYQFTGNPNILINYPKEEKPFEYNERNNINCAKFTKIIKKTREKNFKEEGNIIINLRNKKTDFFE